MRIRTALSKDRLYTPIVYLFLALTVWAARFWHCARFGLYEDDYTHIPGALGWTGAEVWNQIVHAFRMFAEHGKLLHPTFIYTFTFAGRHLGGLLGVYLIGYLFVTLNAILLYVLLNRLFGRSLALVGAIAFCLYSADTTQAFLTHALVLQPAMMFFLLSAHSYRAGKRALVYPLAFVVLFTYETPFTLFFALPFLDEKWDRKFLKRLLINALLLSIVLLINVAIRKLMGESRIMELSLSDAFKTALNHMAIGPVVSLGTYLYRPIQTIQSLSAGIVLVIIISFVIFFGVFNALPLDGLDETRSFFSGVKRQGLRSLVAIFNKNVDSISIPNSVVSVVKALTTGLVLLFLAYPLTFTVRAHAISGRDSRVHFAAVVGAAIVIGCVCLLFLQISTAYRRRTIGSIVLALSFALLMGYGFVVQKDYSDAWQYQKAFWTESVQLIPDVDAGTVIMVEPQAFDDTLQIGANIWNTPRVLEFLYNFPAEWEEPPRLYRLNPGWQNNLIQDGFTLKLDENTTLAPPTLFKTVESTDVIFLQVRSDRLSRRLEPLDIDDLEYPVKQSSGLGEPPFEKGILFDVIIRGEAEQE
jgi:hypothetical protein